MWIELRLRQLMLMALYPFMVLIAFAYDCVGRLIEWYDISVLQYHNDNQNDNNYR